MEGREDYIKIENLVNGNIYYIDGRNARIGIYKEETKSFDVPRNKFGYYIDDEDHWDKNESTGTVKPISDLGKAPEFINEKDKLKFLKSLASGIAAAYVDATTFFTTKLNEYKEKSNTIVNEAMNIAKNSRKRH